MVFAGSGLRAILAIQLIPLIGAGLYVWCVLFIIASGEVKAITGNQERSNADQLRQWRTERRQMEADLLKKWVKVGLAAASVLIPVVGLAWGIMLGARVDEQEKLRGLQCLGWFLLGCIVWLVIWRLWGTDISSFMFGSFIDKLRAGAVAISEQPIPWSY